MAQWREAEEATAWENGGDSFEYWTEFWTGPLWEREENRTTRFQ